MISFGGRYAVPLGTYHGVPKGWTKREILEAQKTLRGSYDLDGPDATEPGAPAWLPDRRNWLQYRATLYRVADGVRAGDHGCIEIAARYIVLRHIGSYSGFIRARLARALKGASLSVQQAERLDSHFLQLAEHGEFSEEFSQYLKLWPRFVSKRAQTKLASLAAAHLGDKRWKWAQDFVPNSKSNGQTTIVAPKRKPAPARRSLKR